METLNSQSIKWKTPQTMCITPSKLQWMAALTILLPVHLSKAGPRESPLISSSPLLAPWAVILFCHKEYHQTDEVVFSGEYMKWVNWPGLRRIKQYLQHLEPSIQTCDTALSLSACYPSLAPSGATVFSLECDLTTNRSEDITNERVQCNRLRMFLLFDDYKRHQEAQGLVYNVYSDNPFRAICIAGKTTIMRYTLTAEEEESLVRPNNPTTVQDLSADFLHCSILPWDKEHLDAFKMYQLNDLNDFSTLTNAIVWLPRITIFWRARQMLWERRLSIYCMT